jgi:hypothetical protein
VRSPGNKNKKFGGKNKALENVNKYIWCPKKDGLVRKDPRACRENCNQRHTCRAYKSYWQPELFGCSTWLQNGRKKLVEK